VFSYAHLHMQAQVVETNCNCFIPTRTLLQCKSYLRTEGTVSSTSLVQYLPTGLQRLEP